MPKTPLDGIDDHLKQTEVWNNRNKNIPVAIELDNSNEDYPVSRVIKQDAEGNVVVEKLTEEEEENLRIVYDCDGNKHVLGRDEHVDYDKRVLNKDPGQSDCQYCDNQHCNHDASGNYRHNYHSELEYDEEFDKEIVQKESHAFEDVNELEARYLETKETRDTNDTQDTDFESENEQDNRCTCSLPHYHDYVDSVPKPNIRSRKKKSTISPSTLLEKQKNIIYQQIQKPVIGNFLWDFEYPEDIPDMTEFWLQLPYERKREIASMDFADVLKLVPVDLKSTCTCVLCGHKKALVERELEKLYNGYYNVRRLAVRYLDSVDLNINSINSILGIIEEERTEDEVIEPTDSKLSVTGLLSVADDLVKNNGENFINLIEKLDNHDLKRTEIMIEDNDPAFSKADDSQQKKELVSNSDIQEELWDQSDGVGADELDNDSDEGDLSDASNNSNISNNDYTSEKRLEETYKMLQICASKILRKRLHDAFQAKRAEDISRSLLDEAEKEIRLKKEKEEKEKARKEKAKEKKRLLKLAKEEEQKKLEEEMREKERLLKEEQLRKTEEGRRKKEAERKKREEELRIKQEEKRRKNELEMERQKKEKEEREKKKAETRKLREAEMKAKKEEKERKEMERKLRQQEKQKQAAQQEKGIVDTQNKEQSSIETADVQKDFNIKQILKRVSADSSLRDRNFNLESVPPNYESSQISAINESLQRENSLSEANSNMFSSSFTGLNLPETDAQLPKPGIFDSVLLNDSTKIDSTSDIQKRNHSIWNADIPNSENLYIDPVIDNRHNSIWSPNTDVNLSLNQSNWNNTATDNAMTNVSLGATPQYHQMPVQMMPTPDEELIQQEVLKATWHLPRVSRNSFSIALLYHYTKGLLNNLLPDFTMQKFIDSLSVNLESKINARFHIFRDNNNEDNVEILFRTSPSTDVRFEGIPFSNMPDLGGNFNTLNNATMMPGDSSPYNNLNVNMNTNMMNMHSNIYPNLNPHIDPSSSISTNLSRNLNPNLNPNLNANLNNSINSDLSSTMNGNMLNMLNSNLNSNLSSNLNLNSNAHLFSNLTNRSNNYEGYNNTNYLETSTLSGINNMNPYNMNRPNNLDSSYNNLGFINSTQLGDIDSFNLNVTDNGTNPSINMDTNVGYNPMYLGGISSSMNNLNLDTEVAGSSLLDNLNTNNMKGPEYVPKQTNLH